MASSVGNVFQNTMTDCDDGQQPCPSLRTKSCNAWDLDVQRKLFQRDEEQAQLLAHYELSKQSTSSSIKTQFVLIHGKAGVGKTALAESLSPVVNRDGGYFVKGKFDQLPRPEPLEAVITALGAFAQDVMDRGDEEIQRIRSSVSGIVQQLSVLTALVPQLENVIGETSEEKRDCTIENYYPEAANRFKHAFRLFLRAIRSSEHPVVWFLDDLHWADEVALDLLSCVVQDEDVHCMFISTYRDDSDTLTHRLERMLSQLDSDSVEVTQIAVQELDKGAVVQMLNELFCFDESTTDAIATRVFSQTHGNVFFVLEYLRLLNDSGILWYCNDKEEWMYDEREMSENIEGAGDIVRSKITSLHGAAREMLLVSACLGSRIDKEVLCRLLTKEVVLYDLELIARKGIIVHTDRGGYAFAHDVIQEVTYQSVSQTEQAKLHYRIGMALWKNLDVNELDKFTFVIVGQLMLGATYVTDMKERVDVAKLFLRAGERAMQLSSFHMAYSFLTHGISVLGERRWRDEYCLCVDLYSAAAEAAHYTAHFDDVEKLIDKICMMRQRHTEDSVDKDLHTRFKVQY